MCAGMQGVAAAGGSIDMEACFSQLTLDVIGKAVFNYDFDSLTASSPLIQASPPSPGPVQTMACAW